MTLDGSWQPSGYRVRAGRRDGVRRYAFIIMVIVGLCGAGIPIASVAEVGWAGGPAQYCRDGVVTISRLGPTTTYPGGVGCFEGRPDYFPPLPLYIGGGVLVAIGLVGAIVRTVQIRRGTATD